MDTPSNGLCGGTGLFQRKLDAIFLNVPWVTRIADDMIVYGRTDQEHDANLLNFLEVYMSEKQLNTKPRQDAVPTAQSLILWSHLEWQRTRTWPEEDRSGEEDENPPRCQDNVELPRDDQLP